MLFEKHIKFTANGMCSRNKTANKKNPSGGGLSTCYCASNVTEEERSALTQRGFGVSITLLARGDSIIINLAAVMCTFIFHSMSFGDTPRYVLPLRAKLLPAAGVIDLDGPQLMNLSFHDMRKQQLGSHLCMMVTIYLFFSYFHRLLGKPFRLWK